MDPNRLTQKSREARHDAQTKALRFGHAEADDGAVVRVSQADGELAVSYRNPAG